VQRGAEDEQGREAGADGAEAPDRQRDPAERAADHAMTVSTASETPGPVRATPSVATRAAWTSVMAPSVSGVACVTPRRPTNVPGTIAAAATASPADTVPRAAP
jgi:hypothetical protein